LTQLSLEDLMKVKVTSVSRKEQSLSKVGAAVFVISQEDIRRSGMTNIPDLLRLAPGVDVARVAANTWAISIRGFNDRYSTKVLVLIDGRSIYNQEFSGVWWDQQGVPLEDIDRIEVIRGPGGTVWGANAVNGVINIITKNTKDTRGGIVSVASGSQDAGRGFVQYGGALGKLGNYRAYGNYFNIEKSGLADGSHAADGWHATQSGFRADLNLTSSDTLMVQGDVYRAEEGQTITTVLPNAGFQTATVNDRIKADTTDILSEWNHKFANGSEASLQGFYTNLYRLDQATDEQDVYDLDFRYHFKMGNRHDLVSGIGYRHNQLEYEGFYNYKYDRRELVSNLVSTFLQDEIKISNTVALTVGSKFERNSFTGFEFEPSAQLVWAPSERRAVWFSAARAIRQPSWFYFNSILDASSFPLDGGLGVFRLLGSAGSRAEQMIDFEAGYRTEIGKSVSIDGTVFRSRYSQVATVETGDPFFELSPAPPHLVIPATWANQASARSYGLEAFGTWQAGKHWRLSPGYSFLQINVRRDPSSNDLTVETQPGNSPKHQVRLRSALDLPHRLEWDSTVFYVSRLNPALAGFVTAPVASFVRLDTRLGWRLGEFAEVSITGQNLLGPRRFEFPNTEQLQATPVQRSVVGKVIWRF
jgi:iron complex outermembrane receptor protein